MHSPGMPPCQECARGVALARPQAPARVWHGCCLFWGCRLQRRSWGVPHGNPAAGDAVRDGARIDAFGVGTTMGVAADMPYLDMAYKLVQYDGRPVMKLSTGKATRVDQKQVWRRTIDSYYGEDIIALRREPALPDAVPLLQGVMRASQEIPLASDLAIVRQQYATDRARLAESYRRLERGAMYPIRVSEALATLQHEVETALRQQCQAVPVIMA